MNNIPIINLKFHIKRIREDVRPKYLKVVFKAFGIEYEIYDFLKDEYGQNAYFIRCLTSKADAGGNPWKEYKIEANIQVGDWKIIRRDN